MSGSLRIESALATRAGRGEAALCGYVTAGYPDRGRGLRLAEEVAREVDVLEIGIPFSDPMADGRTVQRASETALRNGFRLEALLDALQRVPSAIPVVLMSYLNPLFAFGFERFCDAAAEAGVCGLVIPDLPLEEAGPYRSALAARGLADIRLTAPASSRDRVERICAASEGFVYAVATNGVTGGSTDLEPAILSYLGRVKRASPKPVLAGFGIREAAQATRICGLVDGVVIGSALIEAVERGESPGKWLRRLRSDMESLQ